ncbi:thioredoxin domain-containing protein [Ameyamaea chiangmaiensis]|uniref:Thioredoxin domain-containing protein n=1 Tax=Ameyamaea chiangmaiensis TaxID=442969 RepID=A0A850PB52_9PROT|nr:thioredoxin domain-containing protein [Ameyamaea chiangmaiensis]MBS4074209.1 thioredoxin domain-containing protein [Ameyamaea chiangmaiensis]NVN39152.1 thioredoxin domain-containing protein [Ameyamaea chiangmaiensis]
MVTTAWHAAELTWGHGPRRLDVFLEPTCPFSVKTFNKLWVLLEHVGPDRLSITIRLQSQPWHLFSGLIVRCILAASTLPEGREQARRVMAAVAARREAFEFEHHCDGPNRDATPNDIIARLEHLSGVPLRAAFSTPDLDRAIKWQCRYARQNGIHTTPTFMIDGLVTPGMSSGDSIEAWADTLASQA